MVKILS